MLGAGRRSSLMVMSDPGRWELLETDVDSILGAGSITRLSCLHQGKSQNCFFIDIGLNLKYKKKNVVKKKIKKNFMTISIFFSLEYIN